MQARWHSGDVCERILGSPRETSAEHGGVKDREVDEVELEKQATEKEQCGDVLPNCKVIRISPRRGRRVLFLELPSDSTRRVTVDEQRGLGIAS